MTNELASDIALHIWRSKYRQGSRSDGERDFAATRRRVARALAAVEDESAAWEDRFFDLLHGFKFLPGGRILAGAGTAHNVTLFNCFVMGPVEDSIAGIFRALQEAAVTMQQGGGIGVDFSALRPRGTPAKGAGAVASGPVSFMDVWDAMCGTILSTGARRGAMMATMRCDHPDIEEFVTAKQQPGRLRRFNLSIQVTDAFMMAVRANVDWPLVFPASAIAGSGGTMLREWPGYDRPVPCRIVRSLPARALWDLILRASYDYAEPGVLFIDRINRLNNLGYREVITATNPCGEVPLPPYGACDLGSLNLTRFVHAPFTAKACVDRDGLAAAAATAVRLLDNVIDVSRFPLPKQAAVARATRRVGLGITGLADALVMLGLRYDDEGARDLAADVMRGICHAAYRASIALAQEKGSFEAFERENYLQGPFIRALPEDIQDGIARHGIRNSHLLAIAPTGTISLLAGNVSSGLEPIFAASYRRKVLDQNGKPNDFVLTDYALAQWRKGAGAYNGFPAGFVTAAELNVEAHLDMQAALQPYVDNSISKTINVPQNCPFDEFKRIYDLAYAKGLKGCTTFRPNPVTGAVLSEANAGSEAPHCCVLEREAD
ncbi:MAG: adenosylcobalamin-dependent ribonucleoside-diphosphate reductase [Pseudolabrys sp.]